MENNNLNLFRKQIDEIDQQMAELFNQRLEIVEAIGKFKIENNLPITSKAREEEVIKRNTRFIKKIEYTKYYHDFMKNIFTISKKLQTSLKGEIKHEVFKSKSD